MQKTQEVINMNIKIYSTGITKSLLKHGFQIINIEPNPRDIKRTIFEFEDTPKIREYLKREHNIVID